MLLLVILILSIACLDSKKILRETQSIAKHYTIGKRASPELVHEFMISINQNNKNKLKKYVDDISHPASFNYGKYLSFEEIGQLVTNPVATSTVISWLVENNVEFLRQTEYGEYIYARASVATLEKLFDTVIHEFKREEFDNEQAFSPELVIRAKSYSLSEHVNHHIHSVHNLVSLPPLVFSTVSISPLPEREREVEELFVDNSRKLDILYPISMVPTSGVVTPEVLSTMYNIVGNSDNYGSQSVYGYRLLTYLQSDINKFLAQYNPTVTDKIINLEPISNPAICREKFYYYGVSAKDVCSLPSSNLEYMTALAGNVPTSYYYDSTNDFIGWIVNITNLDSPPLVNSIPTWTYEAFLTTSDLDTFATEAIKLSARGITIISGSGNDGVTGIT